MVKNIYIDGKYYRISDSIWNIDIGCIKMTNEEIVKSFDDINALLDRAYIYISALTY